MDVGFIGLGIMGSPMAANLIRAGHRVWGFDRDAGRAAELQTLGATSCENLAALAQCEVVITMLPDTPDVEAVLLGVGGVAEHLKTGSVVIDMSTISPRATIEMARRLRERGIEMLDAPVSGGEPGARQARLSIMVGGDDDAFARVLPLFEAMGKTIVHVGPNGHGQKTKLVNQVAGALSLLATVEALRLAGQAGLDLEKTFQAISGGACGSWMLTNLGPKILHGDFAPGFRIQLHQKDLRLAREFVEELGMDAPGTMLCYELFTRALEKGLGAQGNQGLMNLWKE
jgi:2-hydroxy-3-oxopropionate reductase